MNDLDQLRRRLVELSEPAGGRSAGEILDRARAEIVAPPRRRTRFMVAAAAVLALLAGGAAFMDRGDEPDIAVATSSADWTTAVVSMTVPGEISGVTLAFGKVWVATTSDPRSPATTVYVYEADGGALLGTVSVEGNKLVDGRPMGMAVTDTGVWLRTGTGEANGPNSILRIDPSSLQGRRVASPVEGVEMVGYGERLVYVDRARLVILGDDGSEQASISAGRIEGEVEGSDETGLGELHLDDHGLWVRVGGDGVSRLDLDTGEWLGAADLASAVPYDGGELWWYRSTESAGPSGWGLLGVDLDADGARTVALPVDGEESNPIGALPDGRVLLSVADREEYRLLDPATGTSVPAPGPDGGRRAVLGSSLASWEPSTSPTILRLQPVESTAPASPPPTSALPPASLDVEPDRALHHGDQITVTGATGEREAKPGFTEVEVRQCVGTKPSDDLLTDCGSALDATFFVGADGTFRGTISAQRWLGGPTEFVDCAKEPCAVFAWVRTALIEAAAPLTFEGTPEDAPTPQVSAVSTGDPSVLAVTGTGLPPGETVDLAVCTRWDPDVANGPTCVRSSGGSATVDAMGALAIADYPLPVGDLVLGNSCAEPGACELAWYLGVGLPPYVQTDVTVPSGSGP